MQAPQSPAELQPQQIRQAGSVHILAFDVRIKHDFVGIEIGPQSPILGRQGRDHRLDALVFEIIEQAETEGIEAAAAQSHEKGAAINVPGAVDGRVVVRPDRQEFDLGDSRVEGRL